MLPISYRSSTYRQVPGLPSICPATCERGANLVRQFMFARSQTGHGDPAGLPYGVLLKLDGHGDC
jgi:hypothetical protein